ncbi:gamma-glutamylcyclotransferase [Pseudonocardia sp. H11422]|uniref:gamma-glutamylcyclotransferase n=1 Tax=Pseudonocardia sp. H11422 TaxID=2835866 RepID=UPI0027E25062|nr:gamma-glutamylcyclotransferase [Pseudonocardia sp. H11422]
MTYPDGDFPAAPYPGAVPPTSYVHVDNAGRVLRPDPAARAGWRVDGADLDDWLEHRGAPPLAARVPLLTYGSNRNPSKISWLRRNLGLAGPVVVLRARTEGLAAVWAHGRRVRDDQRPAVLAAAPGVVEEHAVWMATPQQMAVLDICEGRGGRYRLARLHSGVVRTEDGARVDAPWCYLGNAVIRRPLLVAGDPVRCTATTQTGALVLVGRPADDDGLDAMTVHGAPRPDEWPAAVFVYGLLQPGQPSWCLVAPHAAGVPHRASAAGTVFDTGRGYPALRPGTGPGAPGWVVRVRDAAALLPALDAYEGPDYRRIRVTVGDGTVCWAYAWSSPLSGMIPLPTGWPG